MVYKTVPLGKVNFRSSQYTDLWTLPVCKQQHGAVARDIRQKDKGKIIMIEVGFEFTIFKRTNKYELGLSY